MLTINLAASLAFPGLPMVEHDVGSQALRLAPPAESGLEKALIRALNPRRATGLEEPEVLDLDDLAMPDWPAEAVTTLRGLYPGHSEPSGVAYRSLYGRQCSAIHVTDPLGHRVARWLGTSSQRLGFHGWIPLSGLWLTPDQLHAWQTAVLHAIEALDWYLLRATTDPAIIQMTSTVRMALYFQTLAPDVRTAVLRDLTAVYGSDGLTAFLTEIDRAAGEGALDVEAILQRVVTWTLRGDDPEFRRANNPWLAGDLERVRRQMSAEAGEGHGIIGAVRGALLQLFLGRLGRLIRVVEDPRLGAAYTLRLPDGWAPRDAVASLTVDREALREHLHYGKERAARYVEQYGGQSHTPHQIRDLLVSVLEEFFDGIRIYERRADGTAVAVEGLGMAEPSRMDEPGPPHKELAAAVARARAQWLVEQARRAGDPASERREDWRVIHFTQDERNQIDPARVTADRQRYPGGRIFDVVYLFLATSWDGTGDVVLGHNWWSQEGILEALPNGVRGAVRDHLASVLTRLVVSGTNGPMERHGQVQEVRLNGVVTHGERVARLRWLGGTTKGQEFVRKVARELLGPADERLQTAWERAEPSLRQAPPPGPPQPADMADQDAQREWLRLQQARRGAIEALRAPFMTAFTSELDKVRVAAARYTIPLDKEAPGGSDKEAAGAVIREVEHVLVNALVSLPMEDDVRRAFLGARRQWRAFVEGDLTVELVQLSGLGVQLQLRPRVPDEAPAEEAPAAGVEEALDLQTQQLVQRLESSGLGRLVEAVRQATRDRPEEFALALPVAGWVAYGFGTETVKFVNDYLPLIGSHLQTAVEVVVAMELAQTQRAAGVHPGLTPRIVLHWAGPEVQGFMAASSSPQEDERQEAARRLAEFLRRPADSEREKEFEAALIQFTDRLWARRTQRQVELHVDPQTGAEAPLPGHWRRAVGHGRSDAIYTPLRELRRRVETIQARAVSNDAVEASWARLQDFVRQAELVPIPPSVEEATARYRARLQAARDLPSLLARWEAGDDALLELVYQTARIEQADAWAHWLYRQAFEEIQRLRGLLEAAEMAGYRAGRLPIEQMPPEAAWALVEAGDLAASQLPRQTQQGLVNRLLAELDLDADALAPAHFAQPLAALGGRSLARLPEAYEGDFPRMMVRLKGLDVDQHRARLQLMQEWSQHDPAFESFRGWVAEWQQRFAIPLDQRPIGFYEMLAPVLNRARQVDPSPAEAIERLLDAVREAEMAPSDEEARRLYLDAAGQLVALGDTLLHRALAGLEAGPAGPVTWPGADPLARGA